MIVNGFLKVTGTHSERWIKVSEIRCFETCGTKGKSPGWPDDLAAIAHLGNRVEIGLDTAQWQEAKQSLGLPQTAALGAPRTWTEQQWINSQ